MTLVTTIFVVCGNVNYTNLSRYSEISERTYRRHFETGIGIEALNQALIEQVSSAQSEPILVVDCTFIEKSGRHTHGLDWFYNGKTQRAERGLEWSVLAIVDLAQKTGYSLSAQQTEAGLAAHADSDQSRIDFYLGHLACCASYIPSRVRYVVADGFYSKRKWVDGVVGLNFQAIGRLRSDANLKFFYNGPQKARGCRRRYGDKVNLSDPSTFEFVCDLEGGMKLYTAFVWSVSLKRPLRLAYLFKVHNGKSSYVVLFSTDITMDAHDIYRYYSARFQIEFIFRDARQFTGLADCQARNSDALDTHVNVSLFALNLAKATLRHNHPQSQALSFSIASFKRVALNQHLLHLFIHAFGLESSLMLSQNRYAKLLNYGAIVS